MKKIIELCVRNVLFVSAAVTTLAIVLIVIFLFRQGVGLFARPAVEEGFSLVVSAGNPVKKLTPQQVKLIFDGDVDNCRSWVGSHEPIEVYRWNEEIPS
jgi:phosphate transport system permease protein